LITANVTRELLVAIFVRVLKAAVPVKIHNVSNKAQTLYLSIILELQPGTSKDRLVEWPRLFP
jgi:hypothetical protein